MAEEAVGQTSEGAARAAPSSSNETGFDLKGVSKVFPGGTLAVDDFNLHIDHGEYVVLLGPSGCGKTTTLRMIGGHDFPTSGDILLDGQSLVSLPPHKRPTTTVFQHFALFPHRTVLQNVEFGLKMHGMGKEERRRLALEALDMVGLEEFGERRPRQLSGGQQQRVALARVLVTKPKALLLDEPLGDLDRLLQLRMRVELRNLQRQLGLTFIHVTHNQEEALSMADRIVVMNDARIQQVADPLTIATRPGDRARRPLHGRQQHHPRHGREPRRRSARARERRASGRACVAPGNDRAVGDKAVVAVRAAAVELGADGTAGGVNSAECEIVFVEFLGDLIKLHLSAEGERMLAKLPGEEYGALRGREGERVTIAWKEEDVQLLR